MVLYSLGYGSQSVPVHCSQECAVHCEQSFIFHISGQLPSAECKQCKHTTPVDHQAMVICYRSDFFSVIGIRLSTTEHAVGCHLACNQP